MPTQRCPTSYNVYAPRVWTKLHLARVTDAWRMNRGGWVEGDDCQVMSQRNHNFKRIVSPPSQNKNTIYRSCRLYENGRCRLCKNRRCRLCKHGRCRLCKKKCYLNLSSKKEPCRLMYSFKAKAYILWHLLDWRNITVLAVLGFSAGTNFSWYRHSSDWMQSSGQAWLNTGSTQCRISLGSNTTIWHRSRQNSFANLT